MRLTQFGTITLHEADGVDVLPLRIRSNFIELQNGGIDLDGNDVAISSSNLTRRAVIVTNLQTTANNLLKEAGKGRLLLRAKDIDNTQYQTFAKVIQINPDINARDYGCQYGFEISWLQDYPFWLLSADEGYYLDDGEILDDGWNLDSGNSDTISITSPNTSTTDTITNNGGSVVYKLYIVLSATGTNVEIGDITITNVTNGMRITYTGGLGDGSAISEGDVTIDCLSKSVLDDTSSPAYNNVTLPNNQTDFMRLELGDNIFDVEFDSLSGTNNLSVQIFWSEHYLY